MSMLVARHDSRTNVATMVRTTSNSLSGTVPVELAAAELERRRATVLIKDHPIYGDAQCVAPG